MNFYKTQKIFTTFALAMFFIIGITYNSNAQQIMETRKSLRQMGFQRISATEIKDNTFKMFDKDWALVTSGTKEKWNTMTISWGSFGILWNKPIVTVYVSSSRYTKEFLDKNEFFTVEFFNENFRKDLAYLGSHSGREEDKVSKTNLTPILTDNDNPTFKESKIIIEAKKIYCQEFDAKSLPKDISDWYKERKIGLHTMYIGEIENIWIKE